MFKKSKGSFKKIYIKKVGVMRKLFERFKSMYCISVLLSIVASILNVIGSYRLGSLLTEETIHSTNILLRNIFILLGVFILFYISNFILENFNSKLKTKIHNTLRRQYAEEFAQTDNAKWKAESISGKVAKNTEVINQMDKNLIDPIFDAFTDIFSIVFSFLALITIHWSVGIVTILLFAVMMLLPGLLQKGVEKHSIALKEENEIFVSSVEDQLQGRMEYAIFQKENIFVRLISNASCYLENKRYSLDKASNGVKCVMGVVSLFSQVVLLGLIIYLSITKGVAIGAVLSVASLSGTFMNAVGSVLSDITSIKANEHLVELKDYTEKTYRETAVEPVEVKDLTSVQLNDEKSISYDHLSFTIEPHDSIALLGESGCGKSTLIKTIFLMDQEYTGSIQLNGIERKELHSFDILKDVAYLDQTVHIFNTSLKNNMTLYADIREAELLDIIKRLKLTHLYESCGGNLNYLIQENGKNLSGGEKQKIALARAYVSNKKIFVLDESLSAIDADSAKDILNDLLSRKDITLIMISHGTEQSVLDRFTKVIQL